MKKLPTLIVLYFSTIGILFSQNKYYNGKKTGNWQHKDAKGLVYAEGTYDNDLRQGEWKFYLDPQARKSQQADVVGKYTNGVKQGVWTATNLRKKISVRAEFENDLINGECIYLDEDNTVLARGLVEDGIRHGKWIIYNKNSKLVGYHREELKLRQKTSEGFYENGVREGKWNYDYFLDKDTHVKGFLSFEDGMNNGKFEFYKVERHEKFGATESLSGVGTYSNGKKSGRWIEFRQGTNGDYIETGDYNEAGNREGTWKISVGQQLYMLSNYKDGKLHGPFEHYYDNGKLMTKLNYQNGFAVGEFENYYQNGQLKEKGQFDVVDIPQKDTTYLKIKLPLEHAFLMVEEDCREMHYEYLQWIDEPAWSIAPAELNRRWNSYAKYANEPQARIANVSSKNRRSVRVGEYLSFYENGSLKLKGEHSAGMTYLFNPLIGDVEYQYARLGTWKEYDEKGLLKYTYIYKDDRLEEMQDGNGYIVHEFRYEKGTLVEMIDATGNAISVNVRVQ